MSKTGPRHTKSINPKGTSAGRGRQATGNCVYHPGWKVAVRRPRHCRDSASKEAEPCSGYAKAQNQAVILNRSSSADLDIRVRSTIKRNIQPIFVNRLNCRTIGSGTHRNRVTQSRMTGMRTRKTEPYGTNARVLNLSLTPSSSRRTTNPQRLPPREQHQPRKEEDRPTAHYVYPTKGRQSKDEEDRPKAHCVYQPKGY